MVSNKRRWDSQTPDDFEFLEYRDVPETDRFAFPNHDAMGTGSDPRRSSSGERSTKARLRRTPNATCVP
ncbi:MAG: hypothetical protein U5J64_05980 [Halobacteriales archaeon]|nr:hypothetical protein [Halobacteriales archaeon]